MDPSHAVRDQATRPGRRSRPLGPLERATLAHVAVLLILATWGYGGNVSWTRTGLALWASLGAAITLAALGAREARSHGYLRPLRWLWPLGAFNLLVLASLFNPTFHPVMFGSELLYAQSAGPRWPWLPSSARPDRALQALWFFDGVYLSCFNLVLVVRQRRALRGLLALFAINAGLLAVFGTVQKLAAAPGLYFGARATPQAHFFASFIYPNHWGAFAVLMVAVCLGLIFHFARRLATREFWHSPASGLLVVVLLLAVSVPLSQSRSCTALLLALLALAFAHWLLRLLRRQRKSTESIVLPFGAGILAILLAGAFAYHLARTEIGARLATTREQIAEMRAHDSFGSRALLYRDTWHMALAKPWCGWGLGSYPTVFFLYNTQQDQAADHLPMYFNDAHSDWLQSLAEAGIIGTALLALAAFVPLYRRRHVLRASPLTSYLLAGCGLLVFYAALEFPFDNGAVVIAFWVCLFCGVHYGRLAPSGGRPAD
jgi:O-antigen ligase